MAKPNTVILALAVGVPEPNLTRLHIAATVAVGLTVAAPLTINTLLQVILTVALGLPLLSLTLTIVEAGTTDDVEVKEPKKLEVDDLRKFCANKRYVIHKIEGDKVYFWYYLVKKQT